MQGRRSEHDVGLHTVKLRFINAIYSTAFEYCITATFSWVPSSLSSTWPAHITGRGGAEIVKQTSLCGGIGTEKTLAGSSSMGLVGMRCMYIQSTHVELAWDLLSVDESSLSATFNQALHSSTVVSCRFSSVVMVCFCVSLSYALFHARPPHSHIWLKLRSSDFILSRLLHQKT